MPRKSSATDPWVDLVTLQNPDEAHVVRSRLEVEDIKVKLTDERMTELDPYLPNPVGSIRLMVRSSDLQLAIGVIRGLVMGEFVEDEWADDAAHFDGPPLEIAPEDDGDTRFCPNCLSDEILTEKNSVAGLGFHIMLLGLPYIVLRKGSQCFRCGHHWTNKKVPHIDNQTSAWVLGIFVLGLIVVSGLQVWELVEKSRTIKVEAMVVEARMNVVVPESETAMEKSISGEPPNAYIGYAYYHAGKWTEFGEYRSVLFESHLPKAGTKNFRDYNSLDAIPEEKTGEITNLYFHLSDLQNPVNRPSISYFPHWILGIASLSLLINLVLLWNYYRYSRKKNRLIEVEVITATEV